MKVVKKIVFAVSMIILIVTIQAYAADCEKIVITGSPVYPPFSWQDKINLEKVTGISVKLVEKAFGELGIPVEIEYAGPWKRTQDAASKGTVDMIAGLYLTETRQAYLDYVFPPFMTDSTVIFVMKGQPLKVGTWDDLVGLVGGGLLGDRRGDDIDRILNEKLFIERVATVDQLFKKLERGRNRYFVYGLYAGMAKAEEMGIRDKIEYVKAPVPEKGMYLAFSKKSPCRKYRSFLSRKIKEYQENKMFDALVEKYLRLWKEQSESVRK